MAGVIVASVTELGVAVLIMCGCGLLVVTPAAAESLQVPAVYVFGDSTVDVGNNGPLPLPYGIDLPDPDHSMPTGRASNGYNLADSISRLLGFNMSPPAYLSLTPETSREVLTGFGGVNYACRGSGILDKTGNKTNSLTMTQQVEFFAETKSKMTEHAGSKGSAAIDTLLSKSLFLISTGGNDMFEFIPKPSLVTFFYAQLLSGYTKHVQTLYSLGARRFGIINVPCIGCVPVIRAMSPTGGCVGLANALAEGFNYLLGARMARLAADPKWSEMTYSIGSSYNLVTNFTADPEAAGFREVDSACCGDGRFGVERWCQANSTVCENRDDYLFWDGAHSSQATANKGAAIIFAAPVELGFAAPINFNQLVSSTHSFDKFSSS